MLQATQSGCQQTTPPPPLFQAHKQPPTNKTNDLTPSQGVWLREKAGLTLVHGVDNPSPHSWRSPLSSTPPLSSSSSLLLVPRRDSPKSSLLRLNTPSDLSASKVIQWNTPRRNWETTPPLSFYLIFFNLSLHIFLVSEARARDFKFNPFPAWVSVVPSENSLKESPSKPQTLRHLFHMGSYDILELMRDVICHHKRKREKLCQRNHTMPTVQWNKNLKKLSCDMSLSGSRSPKLVQTCNVWWGPHHTNYHLEPVEEFQRHDQEVCTCARVRVCHAY